MVGQLLVVRVVLMVARVVLEVLVSVSLILFTRVWLHLVFSLGPETRVVWVQVAVRPLKALVLPPWVLLRVV